MRVVYLHQYFVTPDMSGGTRSYEMARRLVRDGHEVHMITSDRKGGSRRIEDIEGIQVTWIPVRYSQNMGVFRRIIAFLIFAVLASFEGIKKRPTVVFATSTPLTIVFPALAIKLFRRVPMVFEVRDPWPEMLVGMGVLTHPALVKAANCLKKIAYSSSVHIVALSDGMKETIIDSGYESSRITVIPNGSDNDLFNVDDAEALVFRNRFSWLGTRKLVLYAGTLGFANGVGYLVDLALEAKSIDPEIRFVVVGNGAEEKGIAEKARKVGVLNDNFFMLPKVPKDEMPALFAASTISTVILRNVPELWTNSSNKFFDALAAGRPIVVNGAGWQQELLERSNAGLQIHPTDIPAAARKLVAALHDDEWLRTAGINSRKLAEKMFDRDLLYERFKQVLITATGAAEEDYP